MSRRSPRSVGPAALGDHRVHAAVGASQPESCQPDGSVAAEVDQLGEPGRAAGSMTKAACGSKSAGRAQGFPGVDASRCRKSHP